MSRYLHFHKCLLLFTILSLLVSLLLPSCGGETQTPQVEGDIIVVDSTADSGSGTLRQALLDAESGDTITFDSDIFSPNTPATIFVESKLPPVQQGSVTIDASNTGVILDGSKLPEEFIPCIEINSDGNTVKGLQIISFNPGVGIVLNCGAKSNTIGGDRSIGLGLLGQGNLVSKGGLGIGLWDEGVSYNTVTGNIIGMDTIDENDWGNVQGIYIGEGASNNTIGPNNVVAHNKEFGIVVQYSSSLGNTITQNSIHDNEWGGIHLEEGGNTELISPLILDFDLALGTTAGFACPGCIVEIFSDSGSEGELYEGKSLCDDTGVFTFDKDTPFSGPNLTAVATDTNGNTSEFSISTSGSSRSIILQQENGNIRTRLQTKPSDELEDNRIGSLWDNFWAVDMSQIIDDAILPIGLKRLKLSINGISWATIDWDHSQLAVDPEHDELITRLADNGIKITYVLTFWDKETWPDGQRPNVSRFQNEDEIERYLEYVRFVVSHFKDRIQYYEIWNEPDMNWDEDNIEPCIQSIEVDDYINLVRRVVPVIRQEYPEAIIVVGSTMPQIEPGSREYLISILSSDIMPLVDVVAWHPGGPSLEYEIWRDYYNNYPSIVQEIIDVSSAHGFEGEYNADEFVWWTEDDFPPWEHWTYTDIIAAKYYSRFIIMHLGMDIPVKPGGISNRQSRAISFSTIQKLCTIMAGVRPTTMPVEIQGEVADLMSYSFSTSNDELLIAIWSHGSPAEHDTGAEVKLVLPGISSPEVIGIDVLYGFEQELITSTEDGNLVIENLFIKDYPIILRLTQ